MKNTESIDSGEKYLDSRDIISRIEYLRSTLDGLLEAVVDAETPEDTETARDELADWLECETDALPEDLKTFKLSEYTGSADAEELHNLEELASEAEGYGDWHHGEQLIREDCFEEYAQQFAEDIGAIPRDLSWPCNHIDWEAATNALRADYTEVSFGGTSYLIRS